MARIFLSYRRSDTEHLAGRIADHLQADPEIDELFFDIDGIHPGEDFELKIEKALSDSDVCLVLMGNDWRGVRPENQTARLFDDRDFVRLEVSMALKTRTRVLPVLANDAVMPGAEELPADLAGLTKINAVTIEHKSFDRDVENIVDAIMMRKRRSLRRDFMIRHPLLAKVIRSMIGAGAAILILVIVLAVSQYRTGFSLASLNDKGLSWLVIIGTLILGAVVPHLRRRKFR